MTSPEPTASGEILGSALAIAMTLFILPRKTVRHACSGSSADRGMLATKCVAATGGGGEAGGRGADRAGAAIRSRGRSAGRRAARRIRPAERRLHLAAHLHGEIVFVAGDIAPAQALALPDVALEPDLVGESERQQALGERASGWHLPAPDAKPALAR